MTQTVHVQIGNSDNKLTQEEWSKFVDDVRNIFMSPSDTLRVRIHFEGFSLSNSSYQNACWVIELADDDEMVRCLRRDLAWLAGMYQQDSIAWTPGVTEFIKPTGDKL